MDLQSNYDLIAEEYYSARHITSRNFDITTAHSLGQLDLQLSSEGLLLEFGAGKGRVHEFLKVPLQRVIQLDASIKMLQLKERESCLLKILSNADATPFMDEEFTTCVAFLCDPFWSTKFLMEVFRLLKPNGVFLATVPSFTWGSTLRKALNIPPDITRFVMTMGEVIEVPSILVSKDQILNQLLTAGFQKKSIQIISCKLPRSVKEISPHVTISAVHQMKDVYDIELLDLIVAKK